VTLDTVTPQVTRLTTVAVAGQLWDQALVVLNIVLLERMQRIMVEGVLVFSKQLPLLAVMVTKA
tara:strand:- start:338 stop:529 length:192 start_codon:yes stop_codon:yes gene_type:complete